MREHDVAIRVQREVPGGGELPQARLDLGGAGPKHGRQRRGVGCASSCGKGRVDGKPQVFEVEGHRATCCRRTGHYPIRRGSQIVPQWKRLTTAGSARTAIGLNVSEEPTLAKPASKLSLGIAIGIAVGAGLGVALDNLAVGLGIGLTLGIAVGTALDQRHKQKP